MRRPANVGHNAGSVCMQLKVFTAPVSGAPNGENEINAFLRAHRVLALLAFLLPADSNHFRRHVMDRFGVAAM